MYNEVYGLIFLRNATRDGVWLHITLLLDFNNEKCTIDNCCEGYRYFWPCSIHFLQHFCRILCWIWGCQLLLQLCWAIENMLVWLFHQTTFKSVCVLFKNNTSGGVPKNSASTVISRPKPLCASRYYELKTASGFSDISGTSTTSNDS